MSYRFREDLGAWLITSSFKFCRYSVIGVNSLLDDGDYYGGPLTFAVPIPSTSSTGAASVKKDSSKHSENEWDKFWRKTAEDPVAYFTFWLVILTAVLSAASVFQFIMLIRADITSRLAAEAAKRATEIANSTLIETQRAWIKIDSIDIPRWYSWRRDDFRL